MGYSRLFLAAHGIDQILMAGMLGIWFALFYTYCLRDKILNHIESMINKDSNNSGVLTVYRLNLIFSTIAVIFTYLIVYADFVVVRHYSTIPQVWIDRINEKCGYRPMN